MILNQNKVVLKSKTKSTTQLSSGRPNRLAMCLMLMGLSMLSACATMPGATSASNATSAQSRAASANNPAQNQQADEAVDQDSSAAPTADNGINREGRVIQLGRFVEDRPVFETPENNIIELNYEQEDLRLVIEQLGDALQINMIIDPTIDDRVSVRTSADNPLEYDDIWPLLRTLTRNAGITIEQAGNVYEFKKSASSVPVEIVMPGWLNDATSSEVLQVTPLTYISVDAAQEILTPLIQPSGSIVRLGQPNLLGISGSPGQLARVNAMLDVIDSDPFQNQGIQLYELVNSQAVEVAEELSNVLELIEGGQSSYQVLGLERINAVLVIAPANRGFEEVTRWVRVLDAESQEQVEQLFFYRVKNLDAVSLAETLTNVFEQEEELVQSVVGNSFGATPFGVQTLPQAGLIVADQPQLNDGVVSANLTVTIVADEDTNSLLVRSTPRDYRQLLTTINNLDRIPRQVMINAVIGQVTLTDSDRFGVDWTRVSGNAASGPAQLSSSFLPGGLFNGDGSVARQGNGLILTQTFTDGSAIIDATLNALAQNNEVSLLARPTILAANNQEGEIIVGQSVPVNNGSTITNNGTTENISYRDVGIVLNITPQINDDGFVNLEIFQSLSSIEEGGAGGVAGNPTFINQEITTTAVVANQSIIILGGLIQEEDLNQNAGVPFLRNVPVVGNLFSVEENRSTRRELFVILRPQIINGDETDTVIYDEFRATFENVSALFREAGF